MKTPLTSVLILSNACLTSLLLYDAYTGTQASLLMATAPMRFTQPALQITPPTRSASLNNIQDRPLFYASRHYYAPPLPSALPVSPPKPNYRMIGTFVIPGRPGIALLSAPTGASRKVKPGDDLDGWTVTAVDRNSVQLHYNEEMATLSGDKKGVGAGIQVAPLTRSVSPPPVTAVAGGIHVLGSTGSAIHSTSSFMARPTVRPRPYAPPQK